MWCCDWFNNETQDPGQKGSSVVACKGKSERLWFLLIQFYDPKVIEYYSQVDGKTGQPRFPKITDGSGKIYPFTFRTHIPLHFCPQCGDCLKTRILGQLEKFDSLAAKHVELLGELAEII